MIRWTILKQLYPGFKWRTKWCLSWGSFQWHWLEWLFMDMGTKPSLNILMSSSPMILISRLGRFYACFVALKRNQLKSHEVFLSLNPKTHSSHKLCKEVPVVWMHWNLRIKLWVWSHCQGSCFFIWSIVWEITRTITC
jgi:hypothetical protein